MNTNFPHKFSENQQSAKFPENSVNHLSTNYGTEDLIYELNRFYETPWRIDPSRPCYFCGDMNFQAYKNDDGYFCTTCHLLPPEIIYKRYAMSQIYSPNQSQSNLEVLLRANDVARLLNVSRSLAYQLLQSGQIPTVRMGRSVRVRPKDLAEFINQNITQNRQN